MVLRFVTGSDGPRSIRTRQYRYSAVSPRRMSPRRRDAESGSVSLQVVFTLDPVAKPLGCMRQPLGLQPGGVLAERLVQMLGTTQGNMAELERKRALGAIGMLALLHHEIECHGKS